MSENLFPKKTTRRDFLQWSAAALGTASFGNSLFAAEATTTTETEAAKKPVTIGSGKLTFTLDETFGQLPGNKKYGYGCGAVVDSQDRVYIATRLADAPVVVFDKNGTLVETWGKENYTEVGYDHGKQAATEHGLFYSKEPEGEFLYWTDNTGKHKDGRIGARVVKTDLTGKILYTLGNVDKESDTAQKFDFTNPTDVAIAPNGDIYIVDGYGSFKMHRFDKNFKFIKTIGSKGKGKGEFNNNHGVWVSTLKSEPEVYVADRGNSRIEVYSLDLEYKRTHGEVRKPCCFYQHDGLLWIPDLSKRITVYDADDKVAAQLGDSNGVDEKKIEEHPDKFAQPHALCLSSTNDLYVVEWLPYGRVRKFKHTPA